MSVIETAVYGSIITEAAFNTGIVGFFTESKGAQGVSLKEIFASPESAFSAVSTRLTNPNVILNAALQSVVVGLLFNVFTKTLAKPRRKVNAGLKQLGVPVKM
jgi:hypothetical protein